MSLEGYIKYYDNKLGGSDTFERCKLILDLAHRAFNKL